jgi:hypothetical protein
MTELEIRVLGSLLGGEDYHYFSYKVIESETKQPRSVLKPIVDKLKDEGYILFARGLMTDEGQVAGSGFCINPDKSDEVWYLHRRQKLKDLIASLRTDRAALDKQIDWYESKLKELRKEA